MLTSNNNDNLTAAFVDNIAIIRICGRGSFKNSPPMKQFIHQVINAHTAQRILLDMEGCIGMDSTFMGVVAGLSCYIKSKPDFQFRLINLSEKNQKLLSTLGVDRVVDFTPANEAPQNTSTSEIPVEELGNQTADDKLEAAQTSLEAHQKLIEINPENYPKFKAVVEYLQGDVDALSHKKN